MGANVKHQEYRKCAESAQRACVIRCKALSLMSSNPAVSPSPFQVTIQQVESTRLNPSSSISTNSTIKPGLLKIPLRTARSGSKRVPKFLDGRIGRDLEWSSLDNHVLRLLFRAGLFADVLKFEFIFPALPHDHVIFAYAGGLHEAETSCADPIPRDVLHPIVTYVLSCAWGDGAHSYSQVLDALGDSQQS
jgi:hypothetical protein